MKIKRFALLACLAAALLLAAPCAWAQGENLLQNGDFSENSERFLTAGPPAPG